MSNQKKIHSAGIWWKIDDPKVAKGLVRLLGDLQTIMTEEEFHKVLSMAGSRKKLNPPIHPMSPLSLTHSYQRTPVPKRSRRHAA